MLDVTKTADDTAGDSYTEEDVRRLLRSLRRPDLAAANPLGRHLCEVFGTTSALQAVRLLVDITFSGQGHAGARLADLIRKGDIDGRLSHAGIAAEMGLSLRQFFRHRARAVALLTSRVQTLVDGSLSSFHCLEMLADMVATTNAASAAAIYELLSGAEENEQLVHRMRLQVDAGFDIPDAWVNETPEPWKIIAQLLQVRSLVVNGSTSQAQAKLRKLRERLTEPQILSKEIQTAMLTTDAIRARQRHDPAKLQAVAKRLFETGASDHETAIAALLLEAEGALRAGDTNLAESLAREIRRMARASRDIRAAGRVTLLCANIALAANSLNEADELATGAFYALQQQPLDASLCQMTIGRTRLPLGKRWQLLPDVVLRPETAWDRIGLQIIGARYMLRDAKFDEAEELVQRLFDLARANRYDGLAAHALATLAACHGAVRNERAEQDAYVEAWRFYARC